MQAKQHHNAGQLIPTGRVFTLLETLLEQGLLQFPHLLRDQESRSREQWRAFDRRFQQQFDAMEARLALRLESLKGDVAKASIVFSCKD